MFLLRCIFWLSVVYASMSWNDGAFSRHGSFGAAVTGNDTGSFGAFVGHTAQTALGFCNGRATECMKDAASLTTLVHLSLREGSDDLSEDAVDVPLPPPAPRHRIAGAVLTQLR